ncbi:MAG: hypothetical protein AAFR96_02100 [Planctomycetota bacterium]
MTSSLSDIATLAGHRDRITSVAFAPGRSDVVLSAGRDGAVAVWTITGEDTAEALLYRHDAPVTAADFWPDERGLLITSSDGTARTIDLETGDETGRYTAIEALRADATPPTGIIKSINDTTRVASAIVSAVVPLGALITASAKTKDPSASSIVAAAADAVSGRIATLAHDHTLTLYDLGTAAAIRSWTLPTDDQGAVAFAAGSLLVVGSARVMVMSETSDKPLGVIRPHRGSIRGFAHLDHDACATHDAHGDFAVWSVSRRDVISRFTSPFHPSHACACGRNRVLIADAGRRVAMLDASREMQAEVHETGIRRARAIAASDNGARIAIASDDNRLRVFAAPG